MKINVRTEEQSGITIIECEGKLTIGDGDVDLREAVREVLEDGKRNILLDFRRVNMLDSSGLGELISSKSMVANRGGKIALVGLHGQVEEVLEMTRLIGVFEKFESTEEAIVDISNRIM